MKKTYFFLGVVGLILVSAITLRIIGAGRHNPALVYNDEIKISPVAPTSTEAVTTPVNGSATFSDKALVINPKQNDIITSPLSVEGTAVGNWFFEGSLPVKLVDDNNNVIAFGHATAETNWMTEKPVTFTANLEFSTEATSGVLIIAKDNPSGLPENDGFIKVPVKFK